MKKQIIAPAITLTAASLALGAGPALAAGDGTAASAEVTTPTTTAAEASTGTLPLSHSSIQAFDFANAFGGVYIRAEGLPAGQTLSITVDGPHSDTLLYPATTTVSPTGDVHVGIQAPNNAVPEDYLGTYTVTATLEDGSVYTNTFQVTPTEMNPPSFNY